MHESSQRWAENNAAAEKPSGPVYAFLAAAIPVTDQRAPFVSIGRIAGTGFVAVPTSDHGRFESGGKLCIGELKAKMP